MIFSVSEFSFLGAQPIRAGIESGLRKQIPSLELDHLPLADGEDPISGGGWGTEKPGPRKQSIVKWGDKDGSLGFTFLEFSYVVIRIILFLFR